MQDEPRRRTGDCRVKLAPDVLQRLDRMAETYGMPPATLGAFAIVEWLNQKENSLQLGRMAVLDMSRRVGGQVEEAITAALKDPEFDSMLLKATDSIQGQLPIDGEVSKGDAA